MSNALPDDPALWPTNPYELLGIAPGVTSRALRQAYTRLIRTYKPELYPEHFRRIREAYDNLRWIAEVFSFQQEPTSDSHEPTPDAGVGANPVAPGNAVPAAAAEAETAANEKPTEPLRDGDDEVNALWQQALAGRELFAYQRLAELSVQHAGRVEVYLRLYWLLALSPSLDSKHVSADWLVHGLFNTGLAGPLRELYRQQILVDPSEAFTARYGRLLDDSAPAGILADFVDWRFQAACKLGNWEQLADDINWLGERIRRQDDKLWLRLLFSLTNELAWRDENAPARLFESCVDEIQRHDFLSVQFGYAFDRLDLLLSIREGSLKLLIVNLVPPAFLSLIRLAWNAGFDETRPQLLQVLAMIACDRRSWLAHFDRVQHRAPSVLSFFGELLDQLEVEDEYPLSASPAMEDRVASVESFLGRMGNVDYLRWRFQFLDWCLREAIAPEDAAEAGFQFVGAWSAAGAEFAQAAKKDWPLRYVYKACQLFWA